MNHARQALRLQRQVRLASSKPTPPEDVVATTAWGSRAFRVLNFELYASPTGRLRTLAFAGSSAFLVIMTYLVLGDEWLHTPQQPEQAPARAK